MSHPATMHILQIRDRWSLVPSSHKGMFDRVRMRSLQSGRGETAEETETVIACRLWAWRQRRTGAMIGGAGRTIKHWNDPPDTHEARDG